MMTEALAYLRRKVLKPEPGPRKTWTLRNMDCKKPEPRKNWALKILDHEKRGIQLDAEKRSEDHIV